MAEIVWWIQAALDKGECSPGFAERVQAEIKHIGNIVERALNERAAFRGERDAAVARVEFLETRARLLHEECIDCGCALEDPDEPPHCEDTCYPSDEQVWEWEGIRLNPRI